MTRYNRVLGRDRSAEDYWAESAATYVEDLAGEYHRHRLETVRRLIPDELYAPGQFIVDFGCGDAVHVVDFLDAGARAWGADISPEMVNMGHDRLRVAGHHPGAIQVGDVHSLSRVESGSADALLCFNVLAYLSDEEERAFYEHAARLLRPGGHLIVTHSNALFDLFSLNRYTAEFFESHLLADSVAPESVRNLLLAREEPAEPIRYNVRENPLAYRFKLAKAGFDEVQQEFINWHAAPPPVLQRTSYPSTLDVPKEERWKLMFTCSTYGSRSLRG